MFSRNKIEVCFADFLKTVVRIFKKYEDISRIYQYSNLNSAVILQAFVWISQ